VSPAEDRLRFRDAKERDGRDAPPVKLRRDAVDRRQFLMIRTAFAHILQVGGDLTTGVPNKLGVASLNATMGVA
jgi:hypothetical protein